MYKVPRRNTFPLVGSAEAAMHTLCNSVFHLDRAGTLSRSASTHHVPVTRNDEARNDEARDNEARNDEARNDEARNDDKRLSVGRLLAFAEDCAASMLIDHPAEPAESSGHGGGRFSKFTEARFHANGAEAGEVGRSSRGRRDSR